MMGDNGYSGNRFDVLISGDGTMSPIMEEIVSGADADLVDGRVFRIPEDRVREIIHALFVRKYGFFDASDMGQVKLRTLIKTRLYNCCDGSAVAFDAEMADLFSLGKYGFCDSGAGKRNH